MPDLKSFAEDLISYHTGSLTPIPELQRRARAKRIRRRVAVSTGVAAIMASIVLLAIATAGGGHHHAVSVNPSISLPTSVATTLPTPVAPLVTPDGWDRVNYDNASIAAPADWDLITGVECPNPHFAVLIDQAQAPGANCGAGFSMGPPMLAYARLEQIKGAIPAGKPVDVNGHSGVETVPAANTEIYYFPDLSLRLSLVGSQAASIVNTVGWSPGYLLLHPDRPVTVPATWQQVRYGTVTLRVPPNWPIKVLGPSDHIPGVCAYPEFTAPVVDEGTGGETPCNGFHPYTAVASIDGVWLRNYTSIPGEAFPQGSMTLDPAPRSLILLPAKINGQQVAQLVAGPPGSRVAIDLGLGTNPLVAQQILASIQVSQ